MRLNRFIGDFDLSRVKIAITNKENIKQIKTVLRLDVGEHIILSDGRGNSVEAEIASLSKEEIICKKLKEIKGENMGKNVSLYLAILKKENFELAVQKAVEVGVREIVPVITDRTIKTGLNISRLEKIIKEASEQSGRSLVPILSPILEFKNALIDGAKNEEKIIFHLHNEAYKPRSSKSSSIFIGPEGGFTDKEISLAQESGYTVASLGTLTMRGETAAIVATYRTVNNI